MSKRHADEVIDTSSNHDHDHHHDDNHNHQDTHCHQHHGAEHKHGKCMQFRPAKQARSTSESKQADVDINAAIESYGVHLPAISSQLRQLYQMSDQAIHKESQSLRDVGHVLWENPELAYEETKAHSNLTTFLEQQGFTVTKNYHLPTAFKAVYGQGHPIVAVLCEYDSLPGIGHACGHNLIAEAGVAAALGVKAALQSMPADQSGTIVCLGTPAEEAGGGKIDLIRKKVFDEFDIAMMVHPAPENILYPPMLAIQELVVTFKGHASHASAFPFNGVNALDAMVSAYTSISNLRQQFRPGWRVHGVILKGGEKPNIIPALTEAEYYIRAPDEEGLAELKQKVTRCFEAAALSTGCTYEIDWRDKPFSNLKTNSHLAELFRRHCSEFDMLFGVPHDDRDRIAGSTDMGNVSHVVPSIHPCYDIVKIPNSKTVNHTEAFTVVADTEQGHTATLFAAQAMARTALDILTQPDLLYQAAVEFQSAHPQAQHPLLARLGLLSS